VSARHDLTATTDPALQPQEDKIADEHCALQEWPHDLNTTTALTLEPQDNTFLF
jgi:hypothetical protein